MGKLLGATSVVGILVFALYLAHRIAVGVEGWFYTSGAGDVLGWSFIAAMVLAVFAIPAGAWGIAGRQWIVRLRSDERAESLPAILRQQALLEERLRQLETQQQGAMVLRNGDE